MSAIPQPTSEDQQLTPEKKYYKDKRYSASDVALAIIGAGVANAIALLAISTPFTLWNTIVGITILCILIAYAPAPTAKPRLFVAYAAVWSFSFLSGVGIIFNFLFEKILGRERFPNTDSTAQFYSYPFNHDLFFNQFYVKTYHIINQKIVESVKAFTPFNIYDVGFFSAWAVVFLLCFLYLNYWRKRHPPQSTSPKGKPQPRLETPQAKENGTPATPGHLSDTPRSSMGEVQ